MRYASAGQRIVADGVQVGVWTSADSAVIGDDAWTYASGLTIGRLAASVGDTEWFVAEGDAGEWQVRTPSGAFGLEARNDLGRGAFALEGAMPFGRVEATDGGLSLVVPPTMPVAEAVFVLWCAMRMLREPSMMPAIVATSAAVNVVTVTTISL